MTQLALYSTVVDYIYLEAANGIDRVMEDTTWFMEAGGGEPAGEYAKEIR